jgi:hypothetical protein
VHEQLWAQGLRRRLITRGVITLAALLLGTLLFTWWVGLIVAALAAAADTFVRWRERSASSVWRKGQRGERRTARFLRLLLERRGFAVVHGRMIPGHGQLDHLVIGPTGVLVIDNQAVAPETDIAEYQGTLYVDERQGTGARLATALRETASATAALLQERLGGDVTVEPVRVVYGGSLRRGGVSAQGVTLLRAHELAGWIRGRQVRLSPEKQAAIINAARSLPISRQALIVS